MYIASYSIVYSSRTGNTALLARRILDNLPAGQRRYFGPPCPAACCAPLLFVGFWVYNGGCDPATQTFLSQLHGKQVVLFGTAGLGGFRGFTGYPDYCAAVLRRVKSGLAGDNHVPGSFLCQGKIPLSVGEWYKSQLQSDPHNAVYRAMIENFKEAQSHPNQADFAALDRWLRNLLPALKLPF